MDTIMTDVGTQTTFHMEHFSKNPSYKSLNSSMGIATTPDRSNFEETPELTDIRNELHKVSLD